jgi:GDPmannose 4,6-dehydratase
VWTLGTRALITGITGQDGSYLAELLIEQGYKVFGLVRGHDNPRAEAIERLIPDVQFVGGDLLDQASLISALELVQPERSTTSARSRSFPCPGVRLS